MHVSFLIDAAIYAASTIRSGIQNRVRMEPSGKLRVFVVTRPTRTQHLRAVRWPIGGSQW